MSVTGPMMNGGNVPENSPTGFDIADLMAVGYVGNIDFEIIFGQPFFQVNGNILEVNADETPWLVADGPTKAVTIRAYDSADKEGFLTLVFNVVP